MRKRLVRAVIFIAVAFGAAIGAASAAGAVDLGHSMSSDGSMWD
jgi:hypothetical protein